MSATTSAPTATAVATAAAPAALPVDAQDTMRAAALGMTPHWVAVLLRLPVGKRRDDVLQLYSMLGQVHKYLCDVVNDKTKSAATAAKGLGQTVDGQLLALLRGLTDDHELLSKRADDAEANRHRRGYCECKGECKGTCGCTRGGRECTPACGCGGQCKVRAAQAVLDATKKRALELGASASASTPRRVTKKAVPDDDDILARLAELDTPKHKPGAKRRRTASRPKVRAVVSDDEDDDDGDYTLPSTALVKVQS